VSNDILLPEMVSVTLRAPSAQASVYSSSSILVARGFERGVYAADTEVTWLAGSISGQVVGLDEIQRFVAACEVLKREDNLNQPKMWLVTEGKFNQAALSFAITRGVMTSRPQQLRKLHHLLEDETEDVLELDEPDESTVYDIAIPVTPDSELVAVRALEQIAEGIDFDEKAKGQIRMALMEACVNMKEAMGADGGRIHVQFQTGPGKLVIQMRAAARVTSADPMKDWGLKILQTLMDDVRLNHTPQGFELTMAKYLRRGKAEAV